MKSLKWFYLLLGLSGLLILVWGCGQSSYLTSAKIYLQQKPPDYDKATEQLKLEIQANPQNGEAYYFLGAIYGDKGMYREMVENFNKAEGLPLTPDTKKRIQDAKTSKWIECFNSGVAFMNKDSLDIALERFKLCLLIDPSRFEAYLNTASALDKKKDYAGSVEYLEKAYKLKPEDMGVLNGLAAELYKAEKYQESLEIYNKIAEKDPKNLNILINMASIYGKLDQPEKTFEVYNKVLSIDSEYKDGYFNRGLIYLNKAQKAATLLSACLDTAETNPKDKELEARCKKLAEDRKELFQKGESDFKKTCQIDSTDREAALYAGICQFNLGKDQEAKETLEKLKEQDPNNKEIWVYLSIVYTRLGMKEKAQEALEKSK
jgi:tetratricopeptide (TPR) repeat protein